jgi:hypothetical protein
MTTRGFTELAPPTKFILVHSFDGYSTNVPTADLIGGKAMVALNCAARSAAISSGRPPRVVR